MKIAIHECQGSFSDGWIEYCDNNNVTYKLVNCYDDNIIDQVRDCDGLMWHWNQNDYKALLFARALTHSLEQVGIKVFPSTDTAWHFDDKLGQKYLMEAIKAPLVRSYAFYTKNDAHEWIDKTTFPKLMKLRGGASGVNVFLVKTKRQARRLAKKAFGRGFPQINRWSRISYSLWHLKREKDLHALRKFVGAVARLFVKNEIQRYSGTEKGYILFQDFLANNTYDTRLIVIGNRCYGTRRYCRSNDFRASGSGLYDNDPKIFDKRSVQIAFDVARKLNTQSIAYDFIWDDEEPMICEISYIFCREIVEGCDGYWDQDLNWHAADINTEHFMAHDFVESLMPGTITDREADG